MKIKLDDSKYENNLTEHREQGIKLISTTTKEKSVFNSLLRTNLRILTENTIVPIVKMLSKTVRVIKNNRT